MKGVEFVTFNKKNIVPDMEAYQFNDTQIFWLNYAKQAREDLNSVEELIDWLIVREFWKKEWRKEKPDS